MSSMTSPIRIRRVPRFAEAAVERARLTVVVPPRSRAPRAPFAIVVGLLLAGGVVGLLMFNTHMQQGSFRVTDLQQRATALEARKQSLAMQLDQRRDPQRLAREAKALGMVAPEAPAFLRLGDGRLLGEPKPAGPDGAVRINPYPQSKPAELTPPPLVVTVPPSVTAPSSAPAPAPAPAAGARR